MTERKEDIVLYYKELINSAYSKKDIGEIWLELNSDVQYISKGDLSDLRKLLVERTDKLKCGKPWLRPAARTSAKRNKTNNRTSNELH